MAINKGLGGGYGVSSQGRRAKITRGERTGASPLPRAPYRPHIRGQSPGRRCGSDSPPTLRAPLPLRPRGRGLRRACRAGAGTFQLQRPEFPAGCMLVTPVETHFSSPRVPRPSFRRKMAGSSELVVLDPPWDKELATGTESQALVSATPREDFRVRCTSKRAVTEMLQLCGRFVQKLGDALPEEIREPALRDAQWVRDQLATSLLITPLPNTQDLRIQKDPTPGLGRINGAPDYCRTSRRNARGERNLCYYQLGLINYLDQRCAVKIQGKLILM